MISNVTVKTVTSGTGSKYLFVTRVEFGYVVLVEFSGASDAMFDFEKALIRCGIKVEWICE